MLNQLAEAEKASLLPIFFFFKENERFKISFSEQRLNFVFLMSQKPTRPKNPHLFGNKNIGKSRERFTILVITLCNLI